MTDIILIIDGASNLKRELTLASYEANFAVTAVFGYAQYCWN